VRTTFDVAVYGLGFSRVDLTVHTLAARARLWVLPTPLGDGRVCLRLGTAAHRAGWLRSRLIARVIRDFVLLGLVNDVAQDRRVWATKRHLPRPALAAGDGPVGLYRRWAGQFLPEEPAGASGATEAAVAPRGFGVSGASGAAGGSWASGAPGAGAEQVGVPGETTVRSG
jgi:3-Ketosteroid 9alpha-hydroxylase C-terminal domain